jgi:hypothetical protein
MPGVRINPNPSKARNPKSDTGPHVPSQIPSVHNNPKSAKAMNPNFLISLISVEDEVTTPLFSFFPQTLFFLVQDTILNNENVHLRAHEAPNGIFRGTDNGFAPYIETGVYYNGIAGNFSKL